MRILIGILLLCAAACTFGKTLPIKEGIWKNTVLNDDGTVAKHSLDCVTQKNFADMLAAAGRGTHRGLLIVGVLEGEYLEFGFTTTIETRVQQGSKTR